ncbi:MAG: prohibitin family protein [Candidatus Abawacabacteria bacterium]|nr:prohibitin family protein [Candidatus Abawacabacteria bacterium]
MKSKLTAITVAVIVIVLIILDGFVLVNAGEVGVIFDRGRGILPNAMDAGIHLKIPFWQTVTHYTIRTQAYTMSVGEEYSGDYPIEARSRDGQSVRIDATVLYHITAVDAPVIKTTLGSEDDYKNVVVTPKARSILREVVARYDALDLVSEKRTEIVSAMNAALGSSLAENKVTLDEVVLRDINFSPDFAKAIEEKQIAFQRIKTAEYQKQEAEQLKQKKIIEAQAEAEAIKLKGETLRANPAVIQFEFVQKMAPQINWGILPSGALPLIDLKSLTQ